MFTSLSKKIGRSFLQDFYWKRLGEFYLKYLISFEEKKSKYPDVFFSADPVRSAAILLALRRLEKEQIKGSLAEVGVYRGDMSKLIHRLLSNRKFFLFDTFEGFHENDLRGGEDDRFRDTSIDLVKRNIGNLDNIEFRVGYFPNTTLGLEDEEFSFVLLDTDKYEPILEGLKFFYPRLARGGYLFIHDYNSPESEWGVSRAVNEYLLDKQELLIELPDGCGSVVLRKS